MQRRISRTGALALIAVAALAVGACSKSEPAAEPAVEETTDTEPAESSADGVITIGAGEYFFEIPAIPAGEHEFVLQNDGDQVHMSVIVQLLDGKTVDDAMAYIAENGADGKPPEWAKAVGGGFADPGTTAPIGPAEDDPVDGAMLDLAAGDYVALCFIADGMTSMEDKPEKGAKPHAELGMVQGFTVS